jgi:dephospho-CoA kinase
MLIVALTGSMGMGKSTIANRFRAQGIAVFDADAEVHRLYAGEAVPLIEAAFPGTTAGGQVDRAKLAEKVGAREENFRRLEQLVHPLVRAAERRFLKSEADRSAEIAVVEIPLLFETGAEMTADAVIVASTSAAQQRERLFARPGMTEARLEALLRRQMPDAEKRRRADFVVDTSGTVAASEAQVDAIIEVLRRRKGEAFARYWA